MGIKKEARRRGERYEEGRRRLKGMMEQEGGGRCLRLRGLIGRGKEMEREG